VALFAQRVGLRVVEERAVREEEEEDVRVRGGQLEEARPEERFAAGEEHDRDAERLGLGEKRFRTVERHLRTIGGVEEIGIAADAAKVALSCDAVDHERGHVHAACRVSISRPSREPLNAKQPKSAVGEARIRKAVRTTSKIEASNATPGSLVILSAPSPDRSIDWIIGEILVLSQRCGAHGGHVACAIYGFWGHARKGHAARGRLSPASRGKTDEARIAGRSEESRVGGLASFARCEPL
jgi:hypothetical protein